MAKVSAEDLSSRINDLELDENVKISLMEDITDSISAVDSSEVDSLKSELEKKNQEYDELQSRYKERFLTSMEKPKEESKEKDLEEKTIIDIREI